MVFNRLLYLHMKYINAYTDLTKNFVFTLSNPNSFHWLFDD